MSEIRINISDKLETIITDISQNMGVKNTDYIRSLIITDLKNRGIKTYDN